MWLSHVLLKRGVIPPTFTFASLLMPPRLPQPWGEDSEGRTGTALTLLKRVFYLSLGNFTGVHSAWQASTLMFANYISHIVIRYRIRGHIVILVLYYFSPEAARLSYQRDLLVFTHFHKYRIQTGPSECHPYFPLG